VSTPRFELDLGVAGAFGASSGTIDARRGMPDLGTLVEFGPRVRWNIGPGVGGGRWRLEVPLRGVLDLSDGFARRGVVGEPKVIFERQAQGGWVYSTSVGAIVGNRRFADTLYGVAPAFETSDRPAYVAESGLIGWRVASGFSRPLTADWRLFGVARLDSVAGAANRDSPLVRRNVGASIGLGVNYTWSRSARAAWD
jgi:MipA family protein